jgi:hypothetical protein
VGVDEAAEMVNVELTEPDTGTITQLRLNETVRPEGETANDRLTLPEKPAMLVSVIVEVEEYPSVRVRLEGFADMEKACTRTAKTVEFVSVPLVPVTVTEYDPDGVDGTEKTVSMLVFIPPAASWRLVGFSATVGAFPKLALETVAERLTAPLNPLILVKLMSVVVEDPAGNETDGGRASIPKLGEVEPDATGAQFEGPLPSPPVVAESIS